MTNEQLTGEMTEKITITEAEVAAMSLEELLEFFQPGANIEVVAGAEQPKLRFAVDNDEKANWALRKIGQMQKDLADKQALAAAEKAKIDLWLTAASKPIQSTIATFEGMLEQYTRSLQSLDPKFKSRKLPKGTIALRAQQPIFEKDENQLKAWARERSLGQYIKTDTVETFIWTDFKADCEVKDGKLVHKDTKETVDVVKVVDRAAKFDAKVVD